MSGSVTDVWVGSWRPHKPRGPIAALYSSPGPKYALPGATGNQPYHKEVLQLVKTSGGLFVLILHSPCACFRHIGINSHDPSKKKGPAFSFGTRYRLFSSECSPGPGHLVPSNITRVGRDGTPAYSLYSRPKDLQLFQTPGPGQ